LTVGNKSKPSFRYTATNSEAGHDAKIVLNKKDKYGDAKLKLAEKLLAYTVVL